MLTDNQLEGLLELRKLGTQGEWNFNGNEIVSLENTRVGIAGAVSEIDCQLIAEAVNAIDNIRTLQQQKNELIEGVQTAIRWLEGETGTSIRSMQLRMLLEYVEGETP